MFRAICCCAVLMVTIPAFADDVPQMPRDMPTPLLPPAPQTLPQNVPQAPQGTMPRTMQNISPAVRSDDQFMLDCRSNRSNIVFLIHPKLGLVENVSSFPQWTGALFESETEYILAFADPQGIEFVISRYTGRMTAVAEGLQVLTTGMCRKGMARTLF